MAYTTINKGSSYFNTVLYTGNGSARTITGVGFQPDWVWVKDRTSANYHYLYDVVRGNNLNLFTNDASAEVNITTGQNGGGVGSQASDGFTIVAGVVNTNNVNTNTNLYASWNWLANGAGVSNTAGSITSTVSANTTAGFSIVKFTGNGTGGATIGHGLGKKPNVIIMKSYENGQQWASYWSALGATKNMRFNTTGAESTTSTRWNNTEPTSTLFTVGDDGEVNTSGDDQIAYCFAEVKGYSKFGSYTGNNANDGPFIYTGFKPAFILVKTTNTTQFWTLTDNKRDPFNMVTLGISPNSDNSESTFNTNRGNPNMDFVSNGFKIRTDNSGVNGTNSFIYMAFAENPFVTSTQIPTTAR